MHISRGEVTGGISAEHTFSRSRNSSSPTVFTRETCKCTCPEDEDGWDEAAGVTLEMLERTGFMLQHLRAFNTVGARMRKNARMCDLMILADAGRKGFGCRLEGEDKSMSWMGQGTAVAIEWDENDTEQVCREMMAVEQVVMAETKKLRNDHVLIGTDAVAVRKYVNEGNGGSERLS